MSIVYVWRSEDNLWESVLSLHHGGPRDRLGSSGLAASDFTCWASWCTLPLLTPQCYSRTRKNETSTRFWVCLFCSSICYCPLLPVNMKDLQRQDLWSLFCTLGTPPQEQPQWFRTNPRWTDSVSNSICLVHYSTAGFPGQFHDLNGNFSGIWISSQST